MFFFFCALSLTTLIVISECDVGKTTRYWDCCKASCAWPHKFDSIDDHLVRTCTKDGKPIPFEIDPTKHPNIYETNGCTAGTAFMCADQQPWIINSSLSYGYAAAHLKGQTEAEWCCACYELTFSTLGNKKFIVQITNTGGDLGDNHFDLQIPGGGVGIFNGCSVIYGAPTDGWGKRYGGVDSEAQCEQLPAELQKGCKWRWTFLNGADNPPMEFKRVKCPKEILEKTDCVRKDEHLQVFE